MTDDLANALDAAKNLVAQAEQAKSNADADDYYRSAIKILESVDLLKLDSDAAYLAGYCWYNISSAPPIRVKTAEKYLKLAIDRNPKNFLARCYLGHLMFDDKKFELARCEFQRIPSDAFSCNDQVWRDIKILELRLCCALYLSDWSSALGELEAIGNKVGAVDSGVDLAVPVELQECISLSFRRLPDTDLGRELRDGIVQLLLAIQRKELGS